MRKWIFSVVLALLAIAAVLSSSKFFQPRPEPVTKSSVENISEPPTRFNVVVASEEPVNAPDVDSKRLMAHVQALNYQRYTQQERDRAKNYLTQSLQKLGWSPNLQQFEGGVNILATRQGTDKQAGTIIVAAHYDSVPASPGADDNASGVAVVLELARLFASRPTPRTLQLVFFDQEEAGLRGSIAFTTNKANLQNLHGVIVMDMVGYACYTAGCQKYPPGLPVTPPTDKGDFLAVVGDIEHLPLLDVFQKPGKPGLPTVVTLPIPLKGMLTPDVLRSDHAPFWYQGVGAVLVTDTANLRTPHYHQPSDTPENLDRSFFQGAAQIVINTTTALLESRELLKSPPSTTP
ncbi:M28 family peptidase [Funiculus sociatus GB2-A5]|uniref:M28 family peptidase n=1 Tax=Funiculus sociatus GB2-A5 TaxID=2933946 RepID=A0ABV0JTU9_9CYAN|nr:MULTISPECIES: M28 family peptidase [unclassified Trichocoleus]MBD1906738.1 M28 family peptidase [Trichocoleus sp. FACHB-832]MBD2061471.1 M28 family peptidase [Trichocoleus sp. FACHB-6]